MAEPKDQEQIYIPSASEQRDAVNAMNMAEQQLKHAEKMYADATDATMRAAGLKAVQAAHEEIERVKAKYGRVLDWQKSQAAADKNQVDDKLQDALAAMGGAKSTTATHEAAAGAAAASAAPAPAQVKKHIVQKGESLSLIAKHYYGDIHKWKQLYEANKAVIGDNPDRIQIGQELVIPD